MGDRRSLILRRQQGASVEQDGVAHVALNPATYSGLVDKSDGPPSKQPTY
jgi:hypothetical protein